jgi:hypothetical protein
MAVIEHIATHPGSAYGPPESRVFTATYLRFVVSLTGRGQPCEKMTLDEISDATTVPRALLEEWLCRR